MSSSIEIRVLLLIVIFYLSRIEMVMQQRELPVQAVWYANIAATLILFGILLVIRSVAIYRWFRAKETSPSDA
jgi:hypothetical protein